MMMPLICALLIHLVCFSIANPIPDRQLTHVFLNLGNVSVDILSYMYLCHEIATFVVLNALVFVYIAVTIFLPLKLVVIL